MRKEVIGDCTLYLGDCLEVLPTLGKVDLILADPPYSSGGAYRSDRSKPTDKKYQLDVETHRNYATFSGDNRDQRSFEKWCFEWMGACRQVSREGTVIGCFIDWRNLACIVDAVQVAGWVYRGCVPWHKGHDQRPRKGWFRSNVEYVVLGSMGPLLTGHMAEGICADGVIYCRMNGAEKEHQTGKPVALMSELMQVRPEWETVLDPFMGSASTALGAIQQGRRFVGIELDEHSFEVACNRIQRFYDAPRLDLPEPVKAEQEVMAL